MERVTLLREQASVLRTLGASFDIESIRDQLFGLAKRCDDLAQSMEKDPRAAGLGSRDRAPDLH